MKLVKKNKLPMLVGGTGFYVNALLNQMQLGERHEENSGVAPKWQDYLTSNGAEKLWQCLKKKKILKQRKRYLYQILEELCVLDSN